MAERGLSVDHTTVWRWVQVYAPEIRNRLLSHVKYKRCTWFMDETYIRVAGRWLCLFRAVDNRGQTVDFYLSETRDREAAKQFLKAALANPDNRPPHVMSIDGNLSYPAAIRELKEEGEIRSGCRHRCRRYGNNRFESDHRSIKRWLRSMQGPRTAATAWAVDRSGSNDQKGAGARDQPPQSIHAKLHGWKRRRKTV